MAAARLCGGKRRGRGLLVVDEGVHEQPLLDEAAPLGLVALQVAVKVVGHDDAVRLEGVLHDEAVVVADNAFPCDAAGRREHQDLLLLQLPQDVLICSEGQSVSAVSSASCTATRGRRL